MVRDLYNFNQHVVGRYARKPEPLFLHAAAIGVINLVAVPMSLVDLIRAVNLCCEAIGLQHTWITTQTHGATLSGYFVLMGHEMNHGVTGLLIEFDGI